MTKQDTRERALKAVLVALDTVSHSSKDSAPQAENPKTSTGHQTRKRQRTLPEDRYHIADSQ
jgi:hypothetical protein